MLATAGEPPTGPGWAAEVKWDGVRVVAELGAGEVVLRSRGGRDVTSHYPEVVAALAGTGVRGVLDGEVVTLDGAGRPSFARLQQRMHVAAPDPALLTAVPVALQCFDLLALDGRGTLELPLTDRRELLEALDLSREHLAVPPSWTTTTPAELYAAAAEQGLEGVVAKRLDSRYRPGARSRDWVKTAVRLTTEVVVGGWTPGQGTRASSLGALLLGAHDEAGRLHPVGRVGTGFTAATQRSLREQLDALAAPASPFDGPVPAADRRAARWVRPELVGEVEHREWTAGARLRHPSWRGLRPDRDPAEVRLP